MGSLMGRQRQRLRRPAAFLVLAILMAATCLPHWHPASSPVPTLDSRSTHTHIEVAPQAVGSETEAADCLLCILQQLLAQARAPKLEALPRLAANTAVEPTLDCLISQSPLLYSEPRSPPSA